jgi:hypothetical protein
VSQGGRSGRGKVPQVQHEFGREKGRGEGPKYCILVSKCKNDKKFFKSELFISRIAVLVFCLVCFKNGRIFHLSSYHESFNLDDSSHRSAYVQTSFVHYIPSTND